MDKRTLVIIGVIAALILLIFGVVFFIQGRQISDLEDELTAEKARTEELASQVDSETSDIEDDSEEDAAPEEEPADSDGGSAEAVSTSREFTFVDDVRREGGNIVVVLDYAQMLSGEEAARAAEEAGDESPPPNDYYIVNENPRLRTFTIPADADVTLTTTHDGLTGDPYTITADEWATMFIDDDPPAIRDVPYWATVRGDTILEIEEQYLP